ncbi:MAG: hypothetical protein QW112_00865 [Candidatus Micrarchaeia archaeon]
MNWRKFFMSVLLTFLTAILLGCVQQQIKDSVLDPESKIVQDCIALCQSEKLSGRDLSDGPCLSNRIAENWVCDVAHKPRIDVDNRPENQCPEYRSGIAHHFVEVDPDCNLITKN